jgi:hypothetical protein
MFLTPFFPIYNNLTNPVTNISIGSSYLSWAVGKFGLQGGLMNYTHNNKTEVKDVQDCAKILNPNDPSTYQAAFAAASKHN